MLELYRIFPCKDNTARRLYLNQHHSSPDVSLRLDVNLFPVIFAYFEALRVLI
jgi:hypothetical protein